MGGRVISRLARKHRRIVGRFVVFSRKIATVVAPDPFDRVALIEQSGELKMDELTMFTSSANFAKARRQLRVLVHYAKCRMTLSRHPLQEVTKQWA